MPAKTWAPFERLLSDDMNTYLAQQVVSIFADAAARDAALLAPVTGQTAYLTTPQTLTVWSGSAWLVLARRAAAATLGASSTQSIANNTPTQITLATVVEDFGGFALGSSQLTVPAGLAGLYLVLGNIFWASQTTVVGFRNIEVRVGGTTAIARAIQSQGTASIAAIQSVSGLARLAAADVVSLWGSHTHGAAINSANDQLYAPRLSIVRLGD